MLADYKQDDIIEFEPIEKVRNTFKKFLYVSSIDFKEII